MAEMKLVMTLKVRDEDDVLEDNLRFHRALGVDFFIVTDNGSVDRTTEILERYARAGLAHVIRDESTDLRAHEVTWMTDMARLAATEYEADWVFHGDADEFWWPARGTLKDTLAAIAQRFGAVVCPRAEFVARPDGAGSFADRLVIREARSNLRPKVIHRADPDVVALGNTHDVAASRSGDPVQALRPPGRAVLRLVRDGPGHDAGPRLESDDSRLVWAPAWPIRVLHFPVRSFAQFARRVEISLTVGGLGYLPRFRYLREIVEEGRVEELYAQLVNDDAAAERGMAAGSLVRDERLARLLPRCPASPSASPAVIRVEPTPEEHERELGELEFDAMRVLARTQRFTLLRLDEVLERNFELREKLAKRRAAWTAAALLKGAHRRLHHWRVRAKPGGAILGKGSHDPA